MVEELIRCLKYTSVPFSFAIDTYIRQKLLPQARSFLAGHEQLSLAQALDHVIRQSEIGNLWGIFDQKAEYWRSAWCHDLVRLRFDLCTGALVPRDGEQSTLAMQLLASVCASQADASSVLLCDLWLSADHLDSIWCVSRVTNMRQVCVFQF